MSKKELNFEELKIENAKLNEDLHILKKEATKINEDLSSDNKLLKEEISELKAAGKSSQKAVPAKETTPKERGYTLISDLAKHKEQAIKNAPKRNKN